MFGLEGKGDKKVKKTVKDLQEFAYDLEVDLLDREKHQKIRDNVYDRLYRIKAILRSGEMKEEFETLGHLVYGYAALLKVIARATAPKK